MKVTIQPELQYPSKVEILLKRHLINNAEKPILFINFCGDSSELLSPKHSESATSWPGNLDFCLWIFDVESRNFLWSINSGYNSRIPSKFLSLEYGASRNQGVPRISPRTWTRWVLYWSGIADSSEAERHPTGSNLGKGDDHGGLWTTMDSCWISDRELWSGCLRRQTGSSQIRLPHNAGGSQRETNSGSQRETGSMCWVPKANDSVPSQGSNSWLQVRKSLSMCQGNSVSAVFSKEHWRLIVIYLQIMHNFSVINWSIFDFFTEN